MAIVNVEIFVKRNSQLRYQNCSKLQPNFLSKSFLLQVFVFFNIFHFTLFDFFFTSFEVFLFCLT